MLKIIGTADRWIVGLNPGLALDVVFVPRESPKVSMFKGDSLNVPGTFQKLRGNIT